jgi:hypothetical protein
MSIEELLQYDASQLEAFSNEQAKEFFAPYLKFIQPEDKKEEKQGTMDLGSIKSASATKKKYGGKSEIEKTLDLADRLKKMLNLPD